MSREPTIEAQHLERGEGRACLAAGSGTRKYIRERERHYNHVSRRAGEEALRIYDYRRRRTLAGICGHRVVSGW